MTTTYRLHISELTEELINSIKTAFKDKTVEIVVSDEVNETETLRKYASDEDSFKFWMAEEEDLYQDYLKKKPEWRLEILYWFLFPFSELTQVKLRPAVVITETKDRYKDLVLSAISSQVPLSASSAEVIVNPDSLNGLRAVSVIKVDRIFTLKSEKVVATIGRLSLNHESEFKKIFKALVD